MLGWSLIRTIGSYLQQKWSGWRIRRLGLLRCLLNLALTVLAWCFLPLESVRWRTIRERKEVYFFSTSLESSEARVFIPDLSRPFARS